MDIFSITDIEVALALATQLKNDDNDNCERNVESTEEIEVSYGRMYICKCFIHIFPLNLIKMFLF